MRESYPSVPSMSEWLKMKYPNGSTVGVDPYLIAQSTWETLSYEFRNANVTLVEIQTNLIDLIWTTGRYPKRNKDVFVLPQAYTGKKWTKKVDEVRKELLRMKADAMIVTSIDEIAWLLNIRGRDIPFNPFVRSYLLLDMLGIKLFVNQSQLAKNNVTEYFHSSREHLTNSVE